MSAFPPDRLPTRADVDADPQEITVPTVPTHAVDVYLDCIRLVQALLHGDTDSYNAVVNTTTGTPRELVFALVSILAAAAAEHDDPDAAVDQLRSAFVNVEMP